MQHSKVLLLLVAHAVHMHSPEIVKDDEKVHHLDRQGVEGHSFLPADIVLETTSRG